MKEMDGAVFAPHEGKVFTARAGGHGLTLRSVTPQACGFILIFTGPARKLLPEGLHEFILEDGTVFAFYIMPIHTPAGGRQDYQAVFN